MRQLLAVLIHWFPDRQFVFAGDGGYGTHALALFAHRHQRHVSLVSLFYPNANLYDPPPAVVGKRNGRPRKKGDKRPSPEAVVAGTSERTALDVAWYGGGRRDVEAVSGVGQWYKGGERLVPVSWVFVRDRTGTHRDSYLFSTDLALTAQQVIETYTGRWSIETTFQEMRAYLGLETTRGWKERTVLRAAPCLFGLYSVVASLYNGLPPTQRVVAIRWPGKAGVAFSDALTSVRRWVWSDGVFTRVRGGEAVAKLPPSLREILFSALASPA
jgi:hypothetical protein